VLYTSSPDEPTDTAAVEAAEALESLFARAFQLPDGNGQGIHLLYCDPVSDGAMTVAQAEMLKTWRLAHMSLRELPEQE